MAIFELDGVAPDLPADGRYWIADSASVIGRVRLKTDTSIWFGSVLHGCVIGSNSLIGMGAIVLNGARIGRHCLVGAGALVTEGKAFADHSLIVGAPARVVRSLDDKAAREIARAADVYVKRWQRYAK